MTGTASPPRVRFSRDDGFHAALKTEVATYFRATGFARTGGAAMYAKTGVIVAWFAGSYAALQLRLDVLHRAAERAEEVLPTIHLANMGDLERLTRRITTVVNSIVDVARMRGGAAALDIEQVDLSDAARQVISRLRSEIARSGSEVVLEAPEPIVGRWDRARVEQVLTNLLVNALKFGEGNAVRVTVSGDEHRACLSVADGGMGIAPEHQSRIFGPFQTGASGENLPGLGLGLYLCGQIMDAHAGTIEVRSTPGVGSTFTVEFPRDLTSST